MSLPAGFVDDLRAALGAPFVLTEPERYGPWQTVYGRFNQWREDGLWQRIFEQVQVDADQHDNIEWEIHFVDSTTVRAHQDAAGAKKGGTKH